MGDKILSGVQIEVSHYKIKPYTQIEAGMSQPMTKTPPCGVDLHSHEKSED